MEYIEFDESEFLFYTQFSYKTLDFICDMFGSEVRDMLLLPKAVEYVRISDRRCEHVI